TSTAAPSPSATRSAARAPSCWRRCSTSWSARAAATASRPCARAAAWPTPPLSSASADPGLRPRGDMRRAASLAALLLLTTASLACVSASGSGGGDGGDFASLRHGSEAAPWEVQAGVEQITVTGAQPGEPLTLYG